MKVKAIAIATLLLLSTTGQAADYVDMPGYPRKVAYDKDSVKYDNKGFNVWIKMAVKDSPLSYHMQYQFNCYDRTVALKRGLAYSPRGEQVHSTDEQAPQDIIPESFSDELRVMLCK